MRNSRVSILLILPVIFSTVVAQDKMLTIDDVADPEARVKFNGKPQPRVRWLDQNHYLAGDQKVEARTGKSEPFHDAAKMRAALEKLPAMSPEDAEKLSTGDLQMNSSRTAVVINFANDLFYYRFGSDEAVRLTNTAESEVGEEFSPDGRMVSYVRDYNIHIVDIATQKERSLTSDGHAKLFNGRLDWVYQEELYGRGNFQGYWWSPDSRRIAYLQLDESQVRDFTVVDHIPNQQELEVYAYPKAGMPNPTARLGVVEAIGGRTQWVDLFRYQGFEPLIVRVNWTPDGKRVVFALTDREQTWLDLNFADPANGRVTTAFREKSKAWIGADGTILPIWLKDGSFLWVSERNGWQHVYHYGSDFKLIRAVTSGKWEVQEVHGIDESKGLIYFSGAERSHIGLDAYRIRLDGTGLTRLTEAAGTHGVSFDPTFSYFVDVWHDAQTPAQSRLFDADGKLVRIIDENKVEPWKEYRMSRPEYLSVKTRDGFAMEAMMLKPPGFDPNRKYPVFIHTYAGPHAPQVRNAWNSGMGNIWHQLLAQKGYIVWICDNRSASGKGLESTWTIYRNFGELELRDIEDGVSYLKSLPYVDGTRIGINGWSFGGYMTAFALTHSQSFKIGISGAPVTDWHLYDTIYTERFMGTPQNNPEGYEKSSVIKAAKNLSGKLLLIHGTIDDNVHMQNSIQFIHELQKAGKPFELMIYPKSRHGVRDPRQVKHMREMMLRFILDNL
ncbi:MAG: S9 family peptidase [Acidobacteriota bacterium]|nr:MAG: S9 family peptidase [Acidobacteriota bacterium]